MVGVIQLRRVLSWLAVLYQIPGQMSNDVVACKLVLPAENKKTADIAYLADYPRLWLRAK